MNKTVLAIARREVGLYLRIVSLWLAVSVIGVAAVGIQYKSYWSGVDGHRDES